MIKPDKWIKKIAVEHGMIEPFSEGRARKGVISYGLSSYGYDIRLADEFKLLKKNGVSAIDPKKFAPEAFLDFKGKVCVMPPNSFMLGQSMEYFRIPRNILAVGFGKSTYARCGVVVNVTPFEPEWEGYVTLGISNTTSLPAKIYAEEGIAQIIFLESNEICGISYKDKKGKYQKQKEITLAKA
jgi:dCTP deaminase